MSFRDHGAVAVEKPGYQCTSVHRQSEEAVAAAEVVVDRDTTIARDTAAAAPRSASVVAAAASAACWERKLTWTAEDSLGLMTTAVAEMVPPGRHLPQSAYSDWQEPARPKRPCPQGLEYPREPDETLAAVAATLQRYRSLLVEERCTTYFPADSAAATALCPLQE